MWESLDKRKFPRVNIKCDVDVRDPQNAYHFTTVTQNIGAGGICVILPQGLPRFSGVHIRLYITNGHDPIECGGRIIWHVESRALYRDERQYDTGIEFLDISNENRERIRNLVDELIRSV